MMTVMRGYSIFMALFFALLLSLCLTPAASAQTNIAGAQKFDEFRDVPLSDIAARLDNFANELERQPNTRAFLIAYRSQRDLPGLSSRLVNWLRDYLVGARGLPAQRVVAIDGGVAGCVLQELWLVPIGATPTPRSDAYAKQFEDTDSTRMFDEAAYYTPRDYPESFTTEIRESLEGFANALRREPKARGYVIAYAQYRVDRQEYEERGRTIKSREVYLDRLSVAQKELARTKATLVKKYGIPASRIRSVIGGYRKWRSIELWIVPRGEHAPIPTPNAFPKGRR